MTRLRLVVIGVLTSLAMLMPAASAMAAPDLCDFVENTHCDILR